MARVQAKVSNISDEEILAQKSKELNAKGAKTVFEFEGEDDERDENTPHLNAAPVPSSVEAPSSPVPKLKLATMPLTPIGGPWLAGLGWRGGTGALVELIFKIGGDADTTSSDTDGVIFKEASCVTALPDGEICVCDSKAGRLVILTPEGQPRAFLHGGEGKKEGLRMPRGVACDETALYISEVGGSRVRKLRLPNEFRREMAETPRGSHLGGLALAPEECEMGSLTFPQGVCVDAGDLFVADCEDHRIAVYDSLTMAYKRSFGSFGDAPGELSFPSFPSRVAAPRSPPTSSPLTCSAPFSR